MESYEGSNIKRLPTNPYENYIVSLPPRPHKKEHTQLAIKISHSPRQMEEEIFDHIAKGCIRQVEGRTHQRSNFGPIEHNHNLKVNDLGQDLR